jgi:hypothetical protein
MSESRGYRGAEGLVIALLMLALTGCAIQLPPGVGAYGYGGVGVAYYSPPFYNGYVVYYDGAGLPYYYRGGRIVYVPRSYVGYRALTVHYQRYRQQYHRWYRDRGHRYQGYRRSPSPSSTPRRGHYPKSDTRHGRDRAHPPQTGRSVHPRRSIPRSQRADRPTRDDAPRHQGRYSQPEYRRGPSNRAGRPARRAIRGRSNSRSMSRHLEKKR